jgi:hypothetical protein
MLRAPKLIDLVRTALRRVEESSPDDTAVRELKSSVVRSIAERELRKAEASQESAESAPKVPDLTTKDSAA